MSKVDYRNKVLLFVQTFLKGSVDLVWRMMAKTILQRVKRLGMDAALFLMDHKNIYLNGVPSFYHGLFKVCRHFIIHAKKQTLCLGCLKNHWLKK